MRRYWFITLLTFCLVTTLLVIQMTSRNNFDTAVYIFGKFHNTCVPLPPMKNKMSASFYKNQYLPAALQDFIDVPTRSTPSTPEKTTQPPKRLRLPKRSHPPTTSVPLAPSKRNILPAAEQDKCNETSNFVFIKTHKTGSSTLRSLTCRFGYSRNLSFVLGVGGVIGHLNGVDIKLSKNSSNLLPPIGVEKGDFASYKNYNISNIHLIYNKASVTKIMYPSSDLKFFTILREPSEQWLSSFQYFKQYKRAGLKLDSLNQTLLPYLRRLRPGQGGFNQQIRDLGVSLLVTFGTPKVLQETLQRLDNELAFVLITEYFDESLILMKKLFCWSFEDILYVKKRQQPNPLRVSERAKKEILRHSSADVALYNHFLGVFWRRVEEYGPAFHEDLQTFRRLLNDTWDTCIGQTVAERSHDLYLYVENYVAQNSSTFCWELVNSKFAMDVEIVRRQGKLSDRRWKHLR